MKARPKTVAMLQVLNWKFLIMLKPQQKWDVEEKDGEMRLERDNVTMNLSRKEFDKYFKLVGSGKSAKPLCNKSDDESLLCPTVYTRSGCTCEVCKENKTKFKDGKCDGCNLCEIKPVERPCETCKGD